MATQYPMVHAAYMQYIEYNSHKPENAIRLVQFCQQQNINGVTFNKAIKYFDEMVKGEEPDLEPANKLNQNTQKAHTPNICSSSVLPRSHIKTFRSPSTDSYLNDIQIPSTIKLQKKKSISNINTGNRCKNQLEIIAYNIIQKVSKTASIIHTKIMIDIEHLDNMLWAFIDEIETTSSLFTLHSIKNQLLSKLNNSIQSFIKFEGINILKKETSLAKANIINHYRAEISILIKKNEIDQTRINKLENEIDKNEKEMKILQKKTYKLNQLRTSCLHSINQRDYKQKHYKYVCDNSIDILIQNTNAIEKQVMHIKHRIILNETISDKIKYFELSYHSWRTDDIITWIKSIENGYFDDNKYDIFLNKISEMKINGIRFKDMNNNLFLQLLGLNARDQSILLKHIKRVIKLQQKNNNNLLKQYQNNMCGLCTINLINSVIIPCGHQYCCYECSVIRGVIKCPICRIKVTQIIKTFMSGFSATK